MIKNIVYIVSVFLVTGYLSLSIDGSNSKMVFIASILNALAVMLLKHYKVITNKLILLAPLLLYYLLVCFFWKIIANGILPSLLMILPFIFLKKKKIYLGLLALVASFLISFYSYPLELIRSKAQPLLSHNIHDFTFESDHGTRSFPNNMVIVETWGKGCVSVLMP